MKNVFLVGLLFSFSMVFGQSDKGDFTLSPQLGLNLSNYSSSENLSNKIRVAFNAGLIGEYYFSNRWSFRTGLVYDSKGTRLEEAGEDFIDKLNYISLPLHANWHFGSGRNWFLNFGPTLNFLTSAKADIPGGEIDIKDVVNSFDIGLGLGIGYKFNLDENTEFFIEYQGYNGFINVSDDFPIDVKNATSAFNIGAIFKL